MSRSLSPIDVSRGAPLLALNIASAHAQLASQLATLPPIVVTAARSPQPLSELIADVTVIGPEEIARAGAQSLTELLARQPGVEIVMNGGRGSVSGIFLRGANSNHTLVLVDGLRMSSSTVGTTTLEAIPLDQIERIEILRGPASSLYGADALGGVIQVFTRGGGEQLAANASVGYGGYRTRNISGGVSGGYGPWWFALQAGHRQSDGFNAIGNPANFSYNPDRDGYDDNSASGSVAFRFAPDHELSAQFLRSRLNAQFDAGPGFDDRTITTVESYAVLSRDRLAAFWMSKLQAAESSDNSDSQTGFGASRFKTRQRQYAWQNDFTLPRGRLSLAAERREERVDSTVAFPVTGRSTNAFVGVYQLHEGPHALQANLRRDESSQFGGRSSGALAYGYAIATGLRASASYGTAFKAPTFNDLYFPGFSNPNLRPESARNAELALRYARGETVAAVVAYRNRVRDLIVFQCDASFNCAPQNVANATLQGVTLELQQRFAQTELKASADLQRPTDDATGKLLPRRSRRHAALAIMQMFGPWRVGAEVLTASARFDDAANTRRMGGYAIANLLAEYALVPSWTLFARIDNAFDKRYELAADYNSARASVFAGVRYQR